MNPTFLHQAEFEKRTKLTLGWLKRSIEVTNFRGSAAFYSRWRKPLTGWEKGYPETTGYLIETLLDYADLDEFNQSWLGDYAISCADWLCEIQTPEGHYPALLGGKNQASIFNSSQILFGLIRAFQFSKSEKYLDAAEKTMNWLVDSLEENGTWKIGAYHIGFIPSYYTRAVWAVLSANKVFKSEPINIRMKQALEYYHKRKMPNKTIKSWGFSQKEHAFIHTIAYTLRGFLESDLIIHNGQYLESVIEIADVLLNQKLIAGSYNEFWEGDFSFKCVTGHAQLSIIFCKLFSLKKEKKYYEKAISIFEEVLISQNNSSSNNQKGAIPGSVPLYGKYMPMKYPNWAAKFYLDAYLVLKKAQTEFFQEN